MLSPIRNTNSKVLLKIEQDIKELREGMASSMRALYEHRDAFDTKLESYATVARHGPSSRTFRVWCFRAPSLKMTSARIMHVPPADNKTTAVCCVGMLCQELLGRCIDEMRGELGMSAATAASEALELSNMRDAESARLAARLVYCTKSIAPTGACAAIVVRLGLAHMIIILILIKPDCAAGCLSGAAA